MVHLKAIMAPEFNLTLKILVLFEIKNLNLKFKIERNSKFENAITMKQQIENLISQFEITIEGKYNFSSNKSYFYSFSEKTKFKIVVKKRIKNLISQFEITIEVQNSESQSQISIISS
ncbi:unnamed protein product [Rotaria magnacalcarata]